MEIHFAGVGLYQGMISNNPMYADRQASAINAGSSNLMINENVFDSTGYSGIDLLVEKDNQVIRRNIFSNFCQTLNDGGGFYNSGVRDLLYRQFQSL